jgi:excisionase family DNA binding protein
MDNEGDAIFTQGRLLAAGEVAELLGVKASTIKKWVYEKKIPFVKFGTGQKSPVLFNPKRLNQWVDDMSHEPETETEFDHKQNRLKQASKKTIDRFTQFAETVK